jgi:hypothetical protein
MKKLSVVFAALILHFYSFAQQPAKFNGLDMNMATLSKLSDAKTRSISRCYLLQLPYRFQQIDLYLVCRQQWYAVM